MRLRFGSLVVLATLACVGCGPGGGAVQPKEAGLREFLAEFEVALMDAKGSLISLEAERTNPKPRGDGEAEEDRVNPEEELRGVVKMVASSAQALEKSAAGHSAESDVKSIVADAQELLKKSQGRPNPAEVSQALNSLSSKVESLKTRL